MSNRKDPIEKLRRMALARAVSRKTPKRRPRGSASALVEPPRGPLPPQGGAEAPLEFDA